MYELLDGDLLEAARNGRQEAFTDLYRRHVGAARREARRRCRRSAVADDAVASAFASVFRAVMNGGGPADHFRAYLLTAVRNALIDHSRRRDVDDVPLPDTELPDESMPAPDVTPLGASLGAAFMTLPDRQREALWKTEVEGCSNPEVAELLDLTENAFAALKKRARRNLGTAYERELIGGDDLCTWIADRVHAIVAGELGHSHRLMVDLHLDSCDACRELVPDRERRAPLLGLPLLLAAPAIRRLRGPVPTWWSGGRATRFVAPGPQQAAALVALVAGVATVVGLVLGGGEPQQSIDQRSSIARSNAGLVVSHPTAIEERPGHEPIDHDAPRRRTTSEPDDTDHPATVAVTDREHRSIAGASSPLDDAATGPVEGSAPDAGAVAAGPDAHDPVPTGATTATEPAAPPDAPAPSTPPDEPPASLPPADSPTDTAPTVATPTDTTTTTPTDTTTPTAPMPVLIGTTAATTTTTTPTTTPTAPPLIGTIATTTTLPPLIGAIATTTTTTTTPPLIGTIST